MALDEFDGSRTGSQTNTPVHSATKQRGLMLRIQPWGNPQSSILLQQMQVGNDDSKICCIDATARGKRSLVLA